MNGENEGWGRRKPPPRSPGNAARATSFTLPTAASPLPRSRR